MPSRSNCYLDPNVISIQMPSNINKSPQINIAHALNHLNKTEFCFIVSYYLKQENIDFDTMKLKEVIIDELRLCGNKFMKMKRNKFGKSMKKLKIAQGRSAKLYKILKALKAEKIVNILRAKEQEQQLSALCVFGFFRLHCLTCDMPDDLQRLCLFTFDEWNNTQTEAVKKKKGDIDVAAHALDQLSVEQFGHIMIRVLRQLPKDISDNKLEQCKNIILNEKIDGNKFRNTKKAKFAKLFKATGIKKGPLAKIYKIIGNLDASDIDRKLLEAHKLRYDHKGPLNKEMKELNVDEMFIVILHCMDQIQLNVNYTQLSNLLKNEFAMNGKVFIEMGRKAFGNRLKSIGIKMGMCGKLFKQLKDKISVEEINDVLRAKEKEQQLCALCVFGFIRLHCLTCEMPEDLQRLCLFMYLDPDDLLRTNKQRTDHQYKQDKFAKRMENLSIGEFNFVLFKRITCYDFYNANKFIDINEVKQIAIKEKLNGAKFTTMKRNVFAKLYRSSGMKLGHSSNLFGKLRKMQADEIGNYLRAKEKAPQLCGLCVFGFIRLYCLTCEISMPADLQRLCFIFTYLDTFAECNIEKQEQTRLAPFWQYDWLKYIC